MTSNRFPPYYDLCLRCREKGLDQVAEFIHELVNEREQLREILQMWAKFWEADNDDNALEPLLAEEAMEATRVALKEDE